MTLEDSIAIRDLIKDSIVARRDCRAIKKILDKYHIISDKELCSHGGPHIFLGQVIDYFWKHTHPDAKTKIN
jgi:hypothetical protein